jgi:mannose-6-phosphate isomerase-like protein (cupin superfamily)
MLNIHEGKETDHAVTTERLDIFGSSLSVLSDGRMLPMVVGEQIVPAGFAVPNHVHAADDELFYVLDGELTISGPQGQRKACAGDSVELPRGFPHGLHNAAQFPARALVVLLPGVQALEMLRHFHRAGRSGPLTMQEIGSIAAQYGVRFI